MDQRIPTPPATADEWIALPDHAADGALWRLVCSWAGGTDTFLDDVDWSLPLRFFLQARAGRAVRRVRDPSRYVLEQALIAGSPELDIAEQSARIAKPPGIDFADVRQELWAAIRLHCRGSKILVPEMHPRWKRVAKTLQRAGGSASPIRRAAAEQRALTMWESRASSFAKDAARRIGAAFEDHQIPLLESEVRGLEVDLQGVYLAIKRAHAVLRATKPRLVVTYHDIAPPNMEYVLAARVRGLRTLMVQHGLDCENWVLDEAHASHMALWGEERKLRYQRGSTNQPQEMLVTGYPELDHLRVPSEPARGGDYWLWVTRPHSPAKCYLPARCPSEALELLDALFNALEQFREARLLIKPHPYDLVDLYQRRIDERGMGSRVHLVHDSIEALISRASIVFSEDSTAGMDGMFAAKPLIHLHFAPVSPAMPFVEYAAALPGFNSEELLCSIEATLSANRGAAAHMLDGQIAFLRDFAGPCDGHAGARLAESLKRLLAE